MKKIAISLWKGFLSFLYPEICSYCNSERAEGCAFCNICEAFVKKRVSQEYLFFIKQKHKKNSGLTKGVECLEMEKNSIIIKNLDTFFSLLPYTETWKALVRECKFRGDIRTSNYIGKLLRDTFEKIFNIKLRKENFFNNRIIVTPPSSEYEGAAMSDMIASFIAEDTGLVYADNLFYKKRDISQRELKLSKRLENPSQNIFLKDLEYSKALLNARKVIIIDDIVTTGATLERTAFLLKKAGALSVTALTAAYTPEEGIN